MKCFTDDDIDFCMENGLDVPTLDFDASDGESDVDDLNDAVEDASFAAQFAEKGWSKIYSCSDDNSIRYRKSSFWEITN